MAINVNSITVKGGMIATTHGSGPFHPAFTLRATGTTHYWPNITFANEEAAVERAREYINAAYREAAKRVNEWNVY